MSASVRREVGKKVIEAGGNAVLGYSADFDVEDTTGGVIGKSAAYYYLLL